MKGFLNVHEAQTLYDSVLVSPNIDKWDFSDGWFTTFANLGAANDIPFFNVRNRNHGLPYNNQDTRDQTAYGMKIYSIGISFFAPQIATQVIENQTITFATEEIHSAIWEADLPRHVGAILRINQDERLKIQSCMAPPGYGPFGGAMGHGEPAQWSTDIADVPSVMKGATSQSMPELTNRWPFPIPLAVPRRAAISVELKFSEYARQLLQFMTGPHSVPFLQDAGDGTYDYLLSNYACFGIQVSMQVERMVQQRGQYHA